LATGAPPLGRNFRMGTGQIKIVWGPTPATRAGRPYDCRTAKKTPLLGRFFFFRNLSIRWERALTVTPVFNHDARPVVRSPVNRGRSFLESRCGPSGPGQDFPLNRGRTKLHQNFKPPGQLIVSPPVSHAWAGRGTGAGR